MRLRTWIAGVLLGVATVFVTPAATAALPSDTTHMLFTPSSVLDVSQIIDLR